jgi:excisionase family DNA binding protein
MTETLLTTAEAARHCRLSQTTIKALRRSGGGPVFVKLGPKSVRYRRSDLDAWIAARVTSSTSSAPPRQSG